MNTMLFSAKQLHSFLVSPEGADLRSTALAVIRQGSSCRIPTLRECGVILSTARRLLISRDGPAIRDAYLSKWLRPWEVVPELKNFQAPAGDYSVGIEVEYGFRSQRDAAFIANVIKNWRYVTMDSEGGPNGIEVTFAPTLYSKFGPESQACRYLKLLQKEAARVYQHDPRSCIGTHVNVSFAGYDSADSTLYHRMRRLNAYCDTRNGWLYSGYRVEDENPLTLEEQTKYFGRMPYEAMNMQATHVEFKLFDSVTDWKKLRKYVNISVALMELMFSDAEINRDVVIETLERGYNKA